MIEDVNISSTILTSRQVQVLFSTLAQGSVLKGLDMSNCTNLGHVEPQLLARAVSRLEYVNISATDLTNEQVQTIFLTLAEGSELKVLNMNNCTNLSNIEPQLMASVLSKLEYVNITLTSEQVEALFSTLAKGSVLKRLTMTSGTNFRHIEPYTYIYLRRHAVFQTV